jgi:DNA-binding transcriptional ArsR family regulator
MAPDLLSTINLEIDERLSELRPFLAEYDRLCSAADALLQGPNDTASQAAQVQAVKRTGAKRRVGAGRRGSAVGAIERAAAPPRGGADPRDSGTDGAATGRATKRVVADVQAGAAPKRKPHASKPATPKPARAARGVAREAILAALEHGSHTVGELAVVTAMSAPNINGNLRKLFSEGAIAKTEREGKVAWTLHGS